MPDKPYAPSCDKNREPILAVLRERLAERTALLEIGSGTGQHAVYFAPALPRLNWQTSDRAENLPGIRAWLAEAGLPNTPAPIELDVTGPWPAGRFDAVFTANSLHIMPWSAVESMFAALPGVMVEQAIFVAYGPFNYGGHFTNESNARFDASLKASAPHQGIRDFDDLDALARRAGMALAEDVAMPSNNRCLVWHRLG
jgi:SAM-dependent methyltransferase